MDRSNVVSLSKYRAKPVTEGPATRLGLYERFPNVTLKRLTILFLPKLILLGVVGSYYLGWWK